MVNQDPISFNRVKNFIEDRYKEILIGVGCLAVAGIGFYFFMQQQGHKEEQAQLAFAQTIAEVKRGEKNSELLPNAELAAKTGYRAYKNSSLAPYFLSIESYISTRQGKMKETLESLEQALSTMSKSSPFYYIFKLRAALIKLDNDDMQVQTAGFNELQALAQDHSNRQRDEALYYLGDYYMTHNNGIKAKEVWQELVNSYQGTVDSAMSPWAMLALDKAKQIA